MDVFDRGRDEVDRDLGVPVSLRGVGHVFAGGDFQVVALDEIYLEIAAGEFVAVVGPSGCGKTTLLRLVAGLVRPAAGLIEIAGRPVLEPPSSLGFVFQKPVLLEWRSVLDNVLLPVELSGRDPRSFRDKALAALATVGLTDFTSKRPRQLSGGMQQRVALARALLLDPSLLLMDEPFGALDAITRERLNDDLASVWLRTRPTVVFVTHDVSEAVYLADRVVVLSPRPGRIQRVFDVDLYRPRPPEVRFTPDFAAYCREIRATMLLANPESAAGVRQ